MHVLAIYRVNEHLGDLMADAQANRLARREQPRPSLVARVATLLRRPAAPAVGATQALAS